MTEEQVKELTKYAFCLGCGHRLSEPLGLNGAGNPFNSCCPDNNYVVNLALVKSLFAAPALPQPTGEEEKNVTGERDAERFLIKLMQEEPVKCIRWMLVQLGREMVDAHAETMNIKQESNVEDYRYEITAKIKSKKLHKVS
jgi:hypothetical protein